MALLLGMAAVLFESRICKVFYSVHSRRPTNYHFFKQISMMILICFSLLHRRDKGLNLGVFSWSGVRFIMIDIIFWGFVLLCSIVLPSDKGDSDKDTLLKQKKPPLKLFLSPKGHRLTGCKFIIIYQPWISFVQYSKQLPEVCMKTPQFIHANLDIQQMVLKGISSLELHSKA